MMDISKECEKQGILFGTYYSIADWRHPDYPVEQNKGVKEGADMQKYIPYMKAQIKELITLYHTKILWFDGEWEDPWTHEMGMELYNYIRELDDEIIINNRVDKGREGMEGVSKSDRFAGDFATPEQQIGRYDLETPWESCITMCTQWAWKPNDILKTRKECIQTLVRTAGGDGNLLFNMGPMLDGRMEQRQVDRLNEMGNWLEKYGETIYGTHGGPVPPQEWGVSTHRDNTVFLHVTNLPKDDLVVSNWEGSIKYVKVYDSGLALGFKQTKQQLYIELPAELSCEIDLIIEVGIK
jgi:alpha-L-fucosidase